MNNDGEKSYMDSADNKIVFLIILISIANNVKYFMCVFYRHMRSYVHFFYNYNNNIIDTKKYRTRRDR